MASLYFVHKSFHQGVERNTIKNMHSCYFNIEIWSKLAIKILNQQWLKYTYPLVHHTVFLYFSHLGNILAPYNYDHPWEYIGTLQLRPPLGIYWYLTITTTLGNILVPYNYDHPWEYIGTLQLRPPLGIYWYLTITTTLGNILAPYNYPWNTELWS